MKNFLKKHRKLIIIILLVIIAVIAAMFFLRKKAAQSLVGEATYKQYEVVRTDITQNLSGSGSLTAANSYTVTGLYSGEITSANFEEGDQVEQDQVLYVIDSSDSDSDEKRCIKSTIDGFVYSLKVDVGDEVKQGQEIATVVYNDEMLITIPFSALDAENFYEGQDATVVLADSLEELDGYVDSVSALVTLMDGNIRTRNVTICVKNKGALGTEQSATATIDDCNGIESACFEYKYNTVITADTSGTVANVYAKEGSAVGKNQTIVYLEKSDSVVHELSSPISGTVVDKSYKAGETVESGRTLCVIYDLSYLEMTLSIDELDIASVEVGQKVIVTADATPDVEYEGVVTKVSVAGSSMGGTATFPITIRIDEYGDLLPSMSADAVIVLDGAEDVIAVPSAAVQRGNMVMLTADSPSAKAAVEAGGTADENGYVYVNVTLGISDDDNTEIKSGLQEGDTVVYQQSSSNGFGFDMGGFDMGGFGGDMGGGGMPSGGGGGMPSGGGGGGMPSGGGGF